MHKRHGGPGQDTPDPARRPARPLRPLARFVAVLALAACTGTTSGTIAPLPDDLPRFASPLQPRGMARSNADIARDFMDLSFGLESGETLPRLLKYEGPVRIALNSASISNYRPEIDALIRRLRAEAGIDIALAGRSGNRPAIHRGDPPPFDPADFSRRGLFHHSGCAVMVGFPLLSSGHQSALVPPDGAWSDHHFHSFRQYPAGHPATACTRRLRKRSGRPMIFSASPIQCSTTTISTRSSPRLIW